MGGDPENKEINSKKEVDKVKDAMYHTFVGLPFFFRDLNLRLTFIEA